MMVLSVGRIWRWPIGMAVLIVAGLLSALLGQTIPWRAAAWVALSVPLGVVVFYLVKAAVCSLSD
jgi:hypothetical protein